MISAKDFGAVGDGVTDDTKAIQAWAAQKEKRVLDRGIYLVSTPIVFAPGGRRTGGRKTSQSRAARASAWWRAYAARANARTITRFTTATSTRASH